MISMGKSTLFLKINRMDGWMDGSKANEKMPSIFNSIIGEQEEE